MIWCLDVQYRPTGADVAAVGFVSWTQAEPSVERVESSEHAPSPYEPGQFYKRELPLLLAVLAQVRREQPVDVVLIDGHVWLRPDQPGLGAHLYQALDPRPSVIGVAKTRYRDGIALPVARGDSHKPLYVTAVGLDPRQAAAQIQQMHGPHRIPTLIKRADQLARRLVHPRPSQLG
jgi:deoxyribonuclease V